VNYINKLRDNQKSIGQIVDAEKTLTSSVPSSILIVVIVSSLLSVIECCLEFVDRVDVDDGEVNDGDEGFFFVGV